MQPKIIQQGAEAIIFLENNKIIKDRIKKNYRLPFLDDKLRKSRTKSEAKIINKLKTIINVPEVIETTESKITMQYIDGKKLSENLENLDYKEICKQIGEILTKIHNQDIIHGDLTTSNMIYVKNKNPNINNHKTIKSAENRLKTRSSDYRKKKSNENFKIYLIDFGLGFHSRKIEDKAVDLHLLKQALEARHYKISKECTAEILKNYKPNNYKLILERISVIESRGRYKNKH